MIGLAQKSGYEFLPTPYDWRQLRLEKVLRGGRADIPCENWKDAAIIDRLQAALAAA
jgi:hypothetical protein